MDEKTKKMILTLHQIGAIKKAHFVSKNGLESPFEISFASLFSHPKLLCEIADILWDNISSFPFDCVLAIDERSNPLAFALSMLHQIPFLMMRAKEDKSGSRKIVEGVFSENQSCLLVQDVIADAEAALGAAEILKSEKLIVKHVVSFLDLGLGAKESLEKNGLWLTSALVMKELTYFLQTKESPV